MAQSFSSCKCAPPTHRWVSLCNEVNDVGRLPSIIVVVRTLQVGKEVGAGIEVVTYSTRITHGVVAENR